MTGTVTLTPIVLTASMRNPTGKEWVGWIGEVHDQDGRLLYQTERPRCGCWTCVRAQVALWALTYVQDRGGRVLLPERKEPRR